MRPDWQGTPKVERAWIDASGPDLMVQIDGIAIALVGSYRALEVTGYVSVLALEAIARFPTRTNTPVMVALAGKHFPSLADGTWKAGPVDIPTSREAEEYVLNKGFPTFL